VITNCYGDEGVHVPFLTYSMLQTKQIGMMKREQWWLRKDGGGERAHSGEIVWWLNWQNENLAFYFTNVWW